MYSIHAREPKTLSAVLSSRLLAAHELLGWWGRGYVTSYARSSSPLNERTDDQITVNELRQLCFITICRWKRKISRIYINNLRVAGEGDFHLSPLFFFFFSFFFSLSIYNSQAIFIGENDKKKKKGIESNREIDHPSRTNQPPFSRAIICMTRLSVFVANYLLRSCKSLLHSLLLLLYSYLLLSLFFWLLLFDY